MKRVGLPLDLPEGNFFVESIVIEESDRERLLLVYNLWRKLSNKLIEFGGRGVNLPEVLSESCFCLEKKCIRVVDSISGANSSWDCYDLKTSKRIQIKACSVLPDLTSFGPTSEWDEIYFMDFYREGEWDGTFDIYKIEDEDIYNHIVNVSKGETFRDQQNQGRRPRFSIFSQIIQRRKIKPVLTGRLK
ncbi:MAG: Bsp6I family type II restriction endonuclease [Candidatus Marinimicrobia bacterium]|nr:Bsp6I family type II restriction endonuclease [Candidatus Neomarinimicrobiota bacterium]